MQSEQQYVVLSLELHLFFARIMKEHSLFIEVGFTPKGANFAKEARCYRQQLEQLLFRFVSLSNCIITPKVLNSGEIFTEFTSNVECQTQNFTGIDINRRITEMESKLKCGNNPSITPNMIHQVCQLNKTSLKLVEGLIDLKERIINNVLSSCLFTVNYPLLLEHILREAKLYCMYIKNYESGNYFDCNDMKDIECFWNRIMMEHALFIRGLLDPSESELISTSNKFAQDYSRLIAKSNEMNDKVISSGEESLKETLKFRDFKIAGTEGIQSGKIRSIILPLLADHVLREANHYIRLLKVNN